MKRRTVVLEVEVEGPTVDAIDLRDGIARLKSSGGWHVERVEIVSEDDRGR